MDKIKDELHWRGRAVPKQLRKLNQYMYEKSKKAIVGGVRGLLHASRDPQQVVRSVSSAGTWLYNNLLRPPLTAEEIELERILKQVRDAENASLEANEEVADAHHVIAETDTERQRREYRAAQPKPIKFADTVQVSSHQNESHIDVMSHHRLCAQSTCLISLLSTRVCCNYKFISRILMCVVLGHSDTSGGPSSAL